MYKPSVFAKPSHMLNLGGWQAHTQGCETTQAPMLGARSAFVCSDYTGCHTVWRTCLDSPRGLLLEDSSESGQTTLCKNSQISRDLPSFSISLSPPPLPPCTIPSVHTARNSMMDTLGIEPRASRMLSGCDTTTPCAQ